MTVQQAIDNELSKLNLPAREREKRRVLTSIYDFRARNGGRLPATLQELAPEYFESVPIDVNTGQAFKYIIEANAPYVGEREETVQNVAEIVKADGSSQPISKSAETALLASLSNDTVKEEFIYDPSGKRDPFRPFDFAPKSANTAGKTPLEKYAIGQLKLTAVLGTGDGASAIVENSAGKGFPVRKGTKIGGNSGEVIEILPDRLMILERSIDFTGQEKSRTVELRLRTKDQEEAARKTMSEDG